MFSIAYLYFAVGSKKHTKTKRRTRRNKLQEYVVVTIKDRKNVIKVSRESHNIIIIIIIHEKWEV